jgi:Recombinase
MPKSPDDIAKEAIAKYAQFVHDDTQTKLIEGRHVRAQIDGRGSGPLPYGYKRGPYDTIEVDKHQAKIINIMFELAAQKISQARIADELNHRRLTTSLGKPWTASSVQQVMRHALLYATGIREWANETPTQQWPIILHINPNAPFQYALPIPNSQGQVPPTITYHTPSGQIVSSPIQQQATTPTINTESYASYDEPEPPMPEPIHIETTVHILEEHEATAAVKKMAKK